MPIGPAAPPRPHSWPIGEARPWDRGGGGERWEGGHTGFITTPPAGVETIFQLANQAPMAAGDCHLAVSGNVACLMGTNSKEQHTHPQKAETLMDAQKGIRRTLVAAHEGDQTRIPSRVTGDLHKGT